MKIHEVIREFVPCEVCGNKDINQFYFHVFVHKGSQPFVKCCECEEEYYSIKARTILTKVEDAFRERSQSTTGRENINQNDIPHPLLKTLSGIY